MKKINLFLNWYNEKNPDRKRELDECFLLNAESPIIDSLIVYVSAEDAPEFFKMMSRKNTSADTGKVRIVTAHRRPTYNDFFKQTELYPSDINIIANTDIIIDDASFSDLKQKVWLPSVCLALSRWDLQRNAQGKILLADAKHYYHLDSQDVWVFFGAVPQVVGADFTMGIAGCDNVLADLLWKNNIKAYNVSKTLKTYHLHISSVRNYLDRNNLPIKKLPPPYKLLPIMSMTDLEELKAPAYVLSGAKPKLLHISLGHQKGLWEAMDKVFDCKHFDWQAKPHYHVNQQILELFYSFQPDAVFMQIQGGGIISNDTINRMTARSFTANWTGDVRHPIVPFFYEVAPYTSMTLFTNMTDVQTMRSKGVKNVGYLQVGFDENIYTPIGDKNPKYPQIVFMGNNYTGANSGFPLTRLRQEMAEQLLKRFGDKFRVFGSGWNKMGRFFSLNEREEAIAYRQSKIGINLSHFAYSRYSSDRLFRLMGSGTMCLTHHYPDIEKEFVVGEHLDTWKDLNELIRKIEIYTSNEMIRSKIANNGCKYVHENCTWERRMYQFKKIANLS